MRVCWKSLSASFAAGGSTRAMKSAIATVLACAGSEPLGKLVFTDHRSTPFTIGLLLGMHCPQLSLPAGVEAGCASGVLGDVARSEEHTSELQSPMYLVCRLLLEKKKKEQKQKIHSRLATD